MGIWNGNGATEQSSVWAQGGHAPINTNTRRRGRYCSNSVRLLFMRTKDGLACVFAGVSTKHAFWLDQLRSD
jgi:hypothetical protein